MRFPAKFPLSLLALIVAVPLVALLGIKLVLKSPSVDRVLRATVEQSLGLPISYRSIGFTLGGGIRFKAVFAGQNDNPNSFSAESLTLIPDYSELLHGKWVINGIFLDHPTAQISITGWPVPHGGNIPPPSPATPLQNIPPPPPLATKTQSPEKLPTPPSPPPGAGISSVIPRLKIKGGVITLLSEQSVPLIVSQGVDFSGEQSSDGRWGGSAKACQLSIGQGLILHDLEANLILPALSPSLLLKNFTATFGGGTLSGEFSYSLPPTTPYYTLQLNLAGASLSEFFADASLGNAATEGSVNGSIQLSGITGKPKSISGNGQLICNGAVIQPADFLKQIGQILQIQELQLLRIAEGKLFFQIQQGEIQLDQFSLQSQNLVLAAQGPVHANGDLDLQARLLFNGQLTGRLRGLLGSQLSPAPEPGFSQVSFHISGPAKNPRTDLLERLTGIRINGDLGGFLQGLFGHPSK